MDEAEFCERLFEKLQSFSAGKIESIGPDDLLFTTGLIDSMTIVQVIILVEEYWNIQVDPSDLSMDNFDSVAAIMGYVRRKLDGTA
jgi:methoxymalonate biosynthesis acyl carrier protein